MVWVCPEKGVEFLNYNRDAELSTKIIKYLTKGNSIKFELPFSIIILSGYSQGRIITLAEETKYSLAGLLIFSGVLLTPMTIQTASLNSPEISLIQGERDEVIPLQALEYTEKHL